MYIKSQNGNLECHYKIQYCIIVFLSVFSSLQQLGTEQIKSKIFHKTVIIGRQPSLHPNTTLK